SNGKAICPRCLTEVGGNALNLIARHLNKKICDDAKIKLDKSKSKQLGLARYLAPKAPHVPSTVAAPRALPLQSTSAAEISSHLLSSSFTRPVIGEKSIAGPGSEYLSAHLPKFLRKLQNLVGRLPDSIPEGTLNVGLGIYGGKPENRVTDVNLSSDDLWEEIVNPLLHQVFWNKPVENIIPLISRGEYGMDGFITFVTYFVSRGISELLFHQQISMLENAITAMLVHSNIPGEHELTMSLQTSRK
ncbi:hypothetical protein C8J56DRAFT_799797, partial [Mycena floridula]